MNSSHHMITLGETARKASRVIAAADTQTKDAALIAIAGELIAKQSDILAANQIDVQEAIQNGLTDALIDRLTLSSETIANMADGLIQISKLPDPIGEISNLQPRPSGIKVGKMRMRLSPAAVI